jgi:hypothetical protein
MGATYAVSWQEPSGFFGSGRLELGTDALILEGRNGSSAVRRAFPYRNMSGLRVARGSGERLQGRPTLIVELAVGGSLRIAGAGQLGLVSELAARLAPLHPGGKLSECLMLIVPLKPDAKPKAEALLAEGPPFDPAGLGLESHEVFLSDEEAVFVFVGVPAALLSTAAANDEIWTAGEAWLPLVGGPIRYAERAYAWRS